MHIYITCDVIYKMNSTTKATMIVWSLNAHTFFSVAVYFVNRVLQNSVQPLDVKRYTFNVDLAIWRKDPSTRSRTHFITIYRIHISGRNRFVFSCSIRKKGFVPSWLQSSRKIVIPPAATRVALRCLLCVTIRRKRITNIILLNESDGWTILSLPINPN